jgi:F-type H+-transporting ATPase subunit b
MDQLISAFGIDWRLILAQTLNFVLVLGVLSYFLYTPVLKTLEERAKKIKQGLADAEDAARSRVAAEAARADVLKEADHEASLVVARAEDEGKLERSAIIKAAQDRADALLKDARAQADESVRAATKRAEDDIARAAVLAAEKILRTHQ